MLEFDQSKAEKNFINCFELVNLIEKCSQILQFTSITLIAFKLSEELLFRLGWITTPLNTKNKKEQKDLLKVLFKIFIKKIN